MNFDCNTIEECCKEYEKEMINLNQKKQLVNEYVSIKHTHYNVVEFKDKNNKVSYCVFCAIIRTFKTIAN